MTQQLRIVTFNTWNCQGRLSRRLSMMARELKAIEPDIVLLQEVFAQAPQGMNVAKRLSAELDLNFAFAPARRKLRRLNNVPVLCDSGLAVLSRWPISSTRKIRLPEDPRDGQRVAQVVDVDVAGHRMKIANVHLTHLVDADDLREKQLCKVLSTLGGDAVLTVVGGDMNASLGGPRAPSLPDFKLPEGLREIKGTLNPINGAVPCEDVIDHVYLRAHKDFGVEAWAFASLDCPDARTGHFASDHKAVVVNVALRGSVQPHTLS